MEGNKRLTDFQSVREFNETFGVPVHNEPQFNIFDEDPKLVEYRLSLIREEFNELEEAVRNKDMVETLDALADLIYVVQGMACSLGLDLDKAFDIVHKSNMSKVCKNEEEALQTVQFYKENKDTLGYDSPAYRKSADGRYYVVYNESTKKILKSINYTPAKFKWVIRNVLTKETLQGPEMKNH
jgi:NTP pyrophosphatase (non-canonical NTP hydrolase)